jgi:hypothetical protein
MFRITKKVIFSNLGIFLVGFSGYFAVSGDDYILVKVLCCASLGTFFIFLGGGFSNNKKK